MSVDLREPEVPTAGAVDDPRTAKRRRSRRIWLVGLVGVLAGAAIGAAVTLAATGLSQQPQSTLAGAAAAIPILSQPQQRADVLPTSIPGFNSALIVPGSSRLAGTTPTASYYLMVATDGRACLLTLPSNKSMPWAQGCSDRLPFSVAAAGSGSARVLPSDGATPPKTLRFGLNVVVDPDTTSLIK